MKRDRILIVEDDIDILHLLDFNLTMAGFVTSSAMDGADALTRAETFCPDLVVLDLMLPGIDGWRVCSALRERGMNMPVMMLTAKGMPEDKIKGFESGATDYMVKPFEMKELFIRINKLLEHRRQGELHKMLVHEITSRVSTIGCYSKLLEKKDEQLCGDGKLKYLRQISEQVNHTTELISEILSFIDIEAGEIVVRNESVEIGVLAGHVADSYAAAAAYRGVRIEIEECGHSAIEADPRIVRQVLSNIVGNAVKYSGEGGLVRLSVRSSQHGVVVSVRNTGPHIPAADLQRIFDKGFRSSASADIGGSGLGLYIVKTLLERTGSEVSVDSREGEGTEFTVLFRPRRALARRCAPPLNSTLTALS